jgi:hypothetical protein
MSGMKGKPDVMELARAQLDFSALNAGAPGVKDVLFKAQTIVPLAAHPPLTRFAKPAAAALACCALLLLPWVPRPTVLSIAGVEFDARFTREQAQQVIDTAVSGLAQDQRALLGAEFVPRDDNRGQLTVRAASFTLHGADLQQELSTALTGGATAPPPFYAVPATEYVYTVHRSPVQLALDALHAGEAGAVPAYYPAAQLAEQALAGAPVYRRSLTAYLQRRGYDLSGFAFAGNGALLPPGCQFTVDAWPEPVAVGVRGYFHLTAYQKQELSSHVQDWLGQMNLGGPGLLLAEPTAERPLVCEVRDRQNRLDPLLSARLNAAVAQHPPQDLGDFSAIDDSVSRAAEEVLPGLERRVDYERVSGNQPPWRYKVHITLQGRLERDAAEPPDPVDDTAVRGQF